MFHKPEGCPLHGDDNIMQMTYEKIIRQQRCSTDTLYKRINERMMNIISSGWGFNKISPRLRYLHSRCRESFVESAIMTIMMMPGCWAWWRFLHPAPSERSHASGEFSNSLHAIAAKHHGKTLIETCCCCCCFSGMMNAAKVFEIKLKSSVFASSAADKGEPSLFHFWNPWETIFLDVAWFFFSFSLSQFDIHQPLYDALFFSSRGYYTPQQREYIDSGS